MAEVDTGETRRGTGRPTDLAEGEVRKRIINEGARLFADHGYSGASIQDIVDAAGTTKPMVYYYFENKEGLYREIFRTYHEWMLSSQDEITSDRRLSTEEKLVGLADIHFDAARSAPERARFMFAAHFGPRMARPALKDLDHDDVFFTSIVSLATQGIACGDLEGDPVLIAQAFLGQIMIQVACHIAGANPIPLPGDAAERVVSQMMKGVASSV